MKWIIEKIIGIRKKENYKNKSKAVVETDLDAEARIFKI